MREKRNLSENLKQENVFWVGRWKSQPSVTDVVTWITRGCNLGKSPNQHRWVGWGVPSTNFVKLSSCPHNGKKKTNFMRVCIRRYKQMSKCVEAHVFMGFAQACCPLHPSMRAWVLKVRDGLALPDPSHSSCQENRTVKLWRINIQWQLPISHGTFSNCTYLVISFVQGTKSPGCIVHPSHHTETFTLSWETFTLLIFFTSWFWEHILWYLGLLLNPTSGIPSGGALKISWYWG